MDNKESKIHRIKDGKKYCKECKRDLPVSAFSKRPGTVINSICKECTNRILKEQDEETKNKRLFKSRLATLKNHYGVIFIDKEIAQMIIDLDAGICAICKLPFDRRWLHIDHDHVTNKYRGIVCTNCNALLGHAKDSIDILLNAIEYLNNKDNDMS